MKIAILGAGFTGLTAAYKLAQKGHQVFVFEKEGQAGGLARGFKLPGWEWFLEESYHHLFASDIEAFELIKEVGFSDKLFFKRPVTGVYYRPKNKKQKRDNRIIRKRSPSSGVGFDSSDGGTSGIYALDTPLNFFLFPHLSPIDKIRSGLILAYLKLSPFWKSLETLPAKKFIQKTMGGRSWKVLWEPLFINKFGKCASRMPASWFWARIKKRSQKLGYIKGGFQALAEKLVEEIEKRGGRINFNCEVKKVSFSQREQKFSLQPQNLTHDRGPKIYFEKVVVALPTPVFLKITPQLPKNYIKRPKKVTYLNALTLILGLRQPFLKESYWLNICDRRFPFLLLVEHTNFVNPRHYGGRHILYIGNYLPAGHPYFSKTKEELLKIFMPYLRKINPSYNFEFSTLNLKLFISPFAQPVFPLNYSHLKPGLITPLPGLFLANQDQIYPWDRGVNYAIELGKKVAALANYQNMGRSVI